MSTTKDSIVAGVIKVAFIGSAVWFFSQMTKNDAETFGASGSSSKVMTEKDAINALTTAKGKFMTVTFLKKDGSTRRMRCRTGVKRYVKGVGSPLGTAANRLKKYKLITVYDLDKAGYRSIPVDRVISVKAGGKTYNAKNPKGKQMSAEEYNSYNAEWEAIFDVYGRRGYFADLPDSLTDDLTDDEIEELIMEESHEPGWEEVDEMMLQGIEKHNAETFNSDTWRNNSKKLAYMSSKVHEKYPEIPENIIFDYAEGTWPADWDEAAQELINELGATNWVNQAAESYMIDMYGPYGGRYSGTITEKEEKEAETFEAEVICITCDRGFPPQNGIRRAQGWECLACSKGESWGGETFASSPSKAEYLEWVEDNGHLCDSCEQEPADWQWQQIQTLWKVTHDQDGNADYSGPKSEVVDEGETSNHCDSCYKAYYGAESFEAPYVGAGALMDIGKDTGLGSFSPSELATSSAIHGDFDQASLNYSGKQNLEVRAESDRDEDEEDYEQYLRLQGLCECTACGDIAEISLGTTDKQGLYRCTACVTAARPSITEDELVEDLDYLRGVY
jgi:hypothetical protein